MIRKLRKRLTTVVATRAIVVVAASIAGTYFVVRMTEGTDFFRTFMEAAALAFATMVVLSTAQGLLRGEHAESAQAPGGWGLTLRPARRAVGALEQRVDLLAERVNDLDRAVFKEANSGSGEQE
jgi:hypothetical protein